MWTSPKFFYPEPGVLGYSDTLFLLSIPYALARAVGADRFLAFESTIIVFTVIGFVSMLHLLEVVWKRRLAVALLGAMLFVVLNSYYIHIVHPALATVALVPGLLALAARYWGAKDFRPTSARIYAAAAGLLLSLMLFTAFYIGWFTVLFIGTGAFFFGIIECVKDRGKLIARLGLFAKTHWLDVLIGASAFVVALVPFSIVYVPAVNRTGVRSFESAQAFMVPIMGAFDVGPGSWIWGGVARRIEDSINQGPMREHPAGWAYLTMLVFVSSAIYCGTQLSSLRKGGSSEDRVAGNTRLLFAISAACVALWLATTKVCGVAPAWFWLWKWVPGARAIRAPQRANLVISVGLIVVAMYGLEAAVFAIGHRRFARLVLAVAAASALLVEQVNFMPTHGISRAEQARHFSKVVPPPSGCAQFYIATVRPDQWGMLTLQTDAMLVSEQFGIPTINGYSGWFPKGWDLLMRSRESISENAHTWAQRHGLRSGTCAVDIDSGQWTLR